MSPSATSHPQGLLEELAVQSSPISQSTRGCSPRMTRIAYLMKTYPRLSETFILNEILGLEELGARLQIFSLRQPDDTSFHPAVGGVKAHVTYALELTGFQSVRNGLLLLKLHLQLAMHRPAAYVQTVWNYLRQPGRQRLKEVIHAGYFAVAMQRSGCTHIHAHFANVPTTVAELIHGFTGIPYSFTAHAKDIYRSGAAELDRKISKAEFVLTCTEYNRQYLSAISTSATRIHCVHHGIDLTLFDGRKLSSEAEAPTDTLPLILSVGRFCEKKGFPYLIRACRILQNQGVRFRCAIVGYGPMRDELQTLIADLDLEEHVSLVGKMTQDGIAEMYRTAAIFALPCLVTDDGDRDGIPNVLIEAMAQRLAVVSTDVSGISELVEPANNGLLVPEKNADALADALALLLAQPALRKQMGDRGREKVMSHFSLMSSANEVWAKFQEEARAAEAVRGVAQHD